VKFKCFLKRIYQRDACVLLRTICFPCRRYFLTRIEAFAYETLLTSFDVQLKRLYNHRLAIRTFFVRSPHLKPKSLRPRRQSTALVSDKEAERTQLFVALLEKERPPTRWIRHQTCLPFFSINLRVQRHLIDFAIVHFLPRLLRLLFSSFYYYNRQCSYHHHCYRR